MITTQCFFSLGIIVLACMAYGIRNWRLLQIATSVPVFLLFFYFW